jgi:RNA polymerase sigma-70 factor (ECF subfamily)
MDSSPARAPQVPSRPDDIPDLAAIDEVTRGNREMFEVIVRRYNPQLFRVGMAYLRNHAQVEDAMQNAYLKAFLNLSRFQRDAAFSTWLTRIMINECLMLLRRRRRTPEDTLEFVPAEEQSPAPAAAEQLNRHEMKALLEQAIGDLPRNLRAVYVLREVQQMTTADTARCLGISPENVKVTLHRARERLKSALLKTAAGAELFAYPARYCDRMTARVLRVVLAADLPR